jgi:signal peptidase I
MPTDSTTDDNAAGEKSWLERVIHEVKETAITIAVFVPFWLLFSTFVFELRSIPSESMVPALQVGDRVAVAKFTYGYNRNSAPFGLGRFIIGDSPEKDDEGIWVRTPKRGDVVVFQHPHQGRVMIKRVIGLPGDAIEMREGRLFLNDQEVTREEVRKTTYVTADNSRQLITATEYREQLPGEDGSHLIHEFTDNGDLDTTPIFRVPPGHVFMMGDNRDNSEDSRAPSGHRDLASAFPDAWKNPPALATSTRNDAIGFVPLDHLIGRAETVLFTLHGCRKAEGAECPKGRMWKGL